MDLTINQFLNNLDTSTLEHLKREITDILDMRQKCDHVSVASIQEAIMEVLKFKIPDLDKSRKRAYQDAKKIFCYIAYNHSLRNYESIGLLFGQKHDAVIHAVTRFNYYYGVYDKFTEKTDKVLKKLSLPLPKAKP